MLPSRIVMYYIDVQGKPIVHIMAGNQNWYSILDGINSKRLQLGM